MSLPGVASCPAEDPNTITCASLNLDLNSFYCILEGGGRAGGRVFCNEAFFTRGTIFSFSAINTIHFILLNYLFAHKDAGVSKRQKLYFAIRCLCFENTTRTMTIFPFSLSKPQTVLLFLG